MDRLIVCLEKDAGLRSRNPGEYNKITQIVYKSVLPHVKNAYRQCNIFSGVPEIASTLCVYATGQNGVPSFKDLFQYFTEALCCDIQYVESSNVNSFNLTRNHFSNNTLIFIHTE